MTLEDEPRSLDNRCSRCTNISLTLPLGVTWSFPLNRPYYGHMSVSPDLYPASNHMLMQPEVYSSNGYMPTSSDERHPCNSYLPSVSYSLDHLDRLDYQVSWFVEHFSTWVSLLYVALLCSVDFLKSTLCNYVWKVLNRKTLIWFWKGMCQK